MNGLCPETDTESSLETDGSMMVCSECGEEMGSQAETAKSNFRIHIM